MSTIKMRKMTAQDIDAVISLVNRTFNPPSPMDKAFPFIFSPSNTFSYVLEKDHKIVSFIGVVPIKWKDYYGVSIGAVCTDKNYQGQGLLRQLFPYAIDDIKKQAVDFILVSGSGKVYMENGAEFFGTLYTHRINQKVMHSDINLIEYTEDIYKLKMIHQLLDEEKNYNFGINELAVFLEAQGAASVLGLKPQTYLLEHQGTIKGFLTHAYDEKRSRVIEHAGDIDIVIEAIKMINGKLDMSTTDIVTQQVIDDYLYQEIQNEGTIIYTKPELKNELQDLPYALGLRFI